MFAMPFALTVTSIAAAVLGSAQPRAQSSSRFGDKYRAPPVAYGQREVADPIARLQARLATGDATLEATPSHGYLPALLDGLGVLRSSQGLVFSKTSFQNRRIGPRQPRAVYFGDDVYIGYVPGGDVIELTGMDPVEGPVFYTLAQRADGPPRFVRRTDECLTCHGTDRTQGWPANLVRSVHPDPAGHPMQNARSFLTTQDTPLQRRWGGWYVSGTHGDQVHMGNAVVPADSPAEALDRERSLNVTDLTDRFPADLHLSAHSDIVALMVLEHQTHMHSLLARASYEARVARHREKISVEVMGTPLAQAQEATRTTIHRVANEVLEYLLFKNEAPLAAPIAGTSDFAREFAACGPHDQAGRSLRDLDLEQRLFRYPCSYVIYSPCFDGLPREVLDVVYQRLWRILTGRFGRRSWHLSRDQRQAILDILLETKPGLPADWQHVEVR